MRCRRERDYLMSLNGKTHREDKKKKKAVREENIKKGSKFDIPIAGYEWVSWLANQVCSGDI